MTNEAIKLEESTILRVIDLSIGPIYPTVNDKNLPCDSWHLAGNNTYFPSDINEDLLKLIKQKLTKVNFTVEVGNTGYIEWEKIFPDNCYTLDEIGRTVGSVNGVRFFKRYTGTCMLVADIGKNNMFRTLSDEEVDNLVHTINLL